MKSGFKNGFAFVFTASARWVAFYEIVAFLLSWHKGFAKAFIWLYEIAGSWCKVLEVGSDEVAA